VFVVSCTNKYCSVDMQRNDTNRYDWPLAKATCACSHVGRMPAMSSKSKLDDKQRQMSRREWFSVGMHLLDRADLPFVASMATDFQRQLHSPRIPSTMSGLVVAPLHNL